MYIKDWMTKEVITADINDHVSFAVRTMRDNKIKHLPVMKDGKLFGLLTDRKLKEFIPSKGTSLDVYELNYLLETTKLSELVEPNVVTAEAMLPIEEAALKLFEHHINCLPILEGDKLVGIISDKDVFKAMTDIAGSSKKGYRITFTLDDKSGSIKEAADIIRSCGFGIESILSGQFDLKGKRRVVIRSRGEGNAEQMKKAVMEQYPDAEILFRG